MNSSFLYNLLHKDLRFEGWKGEVGVAQWTEPFTVVCVSQKDVKSVSSEPLTAAANLSYCLTKLKNAPGCAGCQKKVIHAGTS